MATQEPLKPQRHDYLTCPVCKYDKLDSSLMLEGERRAPTTGDVVVCMECAAVLTYGDGLRLHETPESTLRFALSPEQRAGIANMQAYVRATAPLQRQIRKLTAELALVKVPHGQLYDFLEAWRAWRVKVGSGQLDTREAGNLAAHGHALGQMLDELERRRP